MRAPAMQWLWGWGPAISKGGYTMDKDRKHEIYEQECGYTCPFPETECPHMMDDSGLHICDLDEPWFDCEDFKQEHQYDIDTAENNIALEEQDNE